MNNRDLTHDSKEQKQFIERAAYLGGFRNLTDFVILTVQDKAKEIIKEKEQIERNRIICCCC